MNVSTIMNPNPVTLSVTETFGAALALMRDRRVRVLPVVDLQGVYQGTFDFHDVWKTLLPKAVLLGMDSLTDLSFVSDAKDILTEKLAEASTRSVGEFLDVPIEPIHPETPVKEAMLLFYQHDGDIPVVDRKTKRLVGIVSPWEIIDSLR
ncbi:MAG: CBS domain-containing protein [Bryobacterales bacterium]|nr:CBS domain-containing protein [Bryobacterales bacterium]